MKIECAFRCGQLVDTDKPGTMLYVSGWAEQRVEGGTHALRDRKVTPGLAAHARCLDFALHGGEQQSLTGGMT